jgi:hypothetical protein
MLNNTYTGWTDDAICAQTDPDKWFPSHFQLELEPMRICHTCPVMRQCARHALETQPEHGIWGGAPARLIAHLYRAYPDQTLEQRKHTIERVLAIGHKRLAQILKGREETRQREREHKAQKRQAAKQKAA